MWFDNRNDIVVQIVTKRKVEQRDGSEQRPSEQLTEVFRGHAKVFDQRQNNCNETRQSNKISHGLAFGAFAEQWGQHIQVQNRVEEPVDIVDAVGQEMLGETDDAEVGGNGFSAVERRREEPEYQVAHDTSDQQRAARTPGAFLEKCGRVVFLAISEQVHAANHEEYRRGKDEQ